MSTFTASPRGDTETTPCLTADNAGTPTGDALASMLKRSDIAAEWFTRWQHNQYRWQLPLSTRRRLALALAKLDGCPTQRRVHRLRASACGLTRAELDANERGSSQDARIERAIEFALAVATHRGHLTARHWQRIEPAGFSEPELVEIIALVGANLLEHRLSGALLTVPRGDAGI